MSKLMRRVLAILPAILLEALWLYIHIKWLAHWSAVINFVLSILAFLLVSDHKAGRKHLQNSLAAGDPHIPSSRHGALSVLRQ